MFHGVYEEIVRFSSEGELAEELKRAKAEYIERTGEIFETDDTFERRIASFLEWYVLDRPVSFAPQLTPAKMYIDSVASNLTTPELTRLRSLTKTVLSLFEFRRAATASLVCVDLLSNRKVQVFERRKPVGLERNDIFEGRLVPYEDKWVFSDAFCFHPREARKAIAYVAKKFRKRRDKSLEGRVAVVHRVAYYSNRCQRYRHVEPKVIFRELQREVAK